MEYYLININDFTIIEKANEYDFLNEFYPTLSDKYRKLWWISNISSLTTINKESLFRQIEKNIDLNLEMYSLPKNILLIKAGNRYMEPLSKSLFKIKNESYLKLVSERTANIYLKEQEQNKIFIENMKNFKSISLVDNYSFK